MEKMTVMDDRNKHRKLNDRKNQKKNDTKSHDKDFKRFNQKINGKKCCRLTIPLTTYCLSVKT